MKNIIFRTGVFVFCLCNLLFMAHAQFSWSLSGKNDDNSITIFKPVAESYKANNLTFRSAVAFYENNNNPIFGAIWGEARFENNSDKMSNVRITDMRFPYGLDEGEKTELILFIEQVFNSNQPLLSIQDIKTDLQNANKEEELEKNFNNTPPKIIFSKETSLLVSIDGDPIITGTSTNGIDAVANTPFLILKYQNNFYLSNGELWYKASSATGNYLPEKKIPKAVKDLEKSLKTDEQAITEAKGNFYPKVIVSTVPAELIQTEGEPEFSSIEGTNLLYVSNTENYLLLDINNQHYYALLSGRWFTSNKLGGNWTYSNPENLPVDFAKIPEGSVMDAVLSSVPGTQAAQEAVKDAQVPYAAIVNRSTTTAEVEYDGNPVFEMIQGTNIQLATNSSGTVLLEGNTYFLVDDGIWFSSNSPYGPWVVSDYRPEHVNEIPPSSPAYNVKYVNIYYSTPEVVYVGYTSGYISNFIVGPVVVYGTGFHYRPWRGSVYYARPVTWGFGMYYNPWHGWSMNVSFGIGGAGWFGFYSPWRPVSWRHHGYLGCGWWGPPVFRPAYAVPYSHFYGHRRAANRSVNFGPRGAAVKTDRGNRQVHNNNIYNYNRSGVTPGRSNPPATTKKENTNPNRNNLNYSNSARPVNLTNEMNKRPIYNNSNANTQTRSANTRQNNNTATTRPNKTNQGTTTRPSTNQSPTTRPANTSSKNQNAVQRPSTQPMQSTNRQSTTTRQNNSNQKQNTSKQNTNNRSRR